jgi:hypothetical protein
MSGISAQSEFIFEKTNMGERFNEIRKVLPTFLRMIEKYSTVQLYQILKIQL